MFQYEFTVMRGRMSELGQMTKENVRGEVISLLQIGYKG
jgi:hypothetical protein